MISFMTPDLVLIYIAFIVDYFLGDPRRLYHPVMAIGWFIKKFENAVLRKNRSKKFLRISGFFLWLTTVLGTFFIVILILWIGNLIHPVLGTILTVILLWLGIAANSLKKESSKVMVSLQREDMPKAREYLSYIVGRDTLDMDSPSIIKATVETVSENTSDGVIAPLFYAFLGGAPLLWAYKAVNTLDSMVGYKNDKYEDFGYYSAKLDDVFNYIPARITALFMMLASLLPGYSFKGSTKVWRKDRRNHNSPNSGHPEAAASGALGIELGGVSSYLGVISIKPSIGLNLKDPEARDIKKVNTLMYFSSILFVLASSVAIYYFERG